MFGGGEKRWANWKGRPQICHGAETGCPKTIHLSPVYFECIISCKEILLETGRWGATAVRGRCCSPWRMWRAARGCLLISRAPHAPPFSCTGDLSLLHESHTSPWRPSYLSISRLFLYSIPQLGINYISIFLFSVKHFSVHFYLGRIETSYANYILTY